ncbi:hypothetical protein FRB99_004389, partial [Tulasnella sp. 403]
MSDGDNKLYHRLPRDTLQPLAARRRTTFALEALTLSHLRLSVLSSLQMEASPPQSTSTWKNALACIEVVWYFVILAFGWVALWAGRTRYSNRPKSPLSSAPVHEAPGVSILRPLKGLDGNLFENLESTCLQQYPKFQIIFCVAEEGDQALTVVSELLQKYPTVDAKVIIGEEVVGVNPKVNNLMRAYKEAKYDILWVLDSNVMMDPGSLARAVDALHAQNRDGKPIGLVHHVPLAFLCEKTFGSRVEEAFLNTNHARMYIALNILAFDSCVTGKSSMYRRSDVEKVNADLKPKSIDANASPRAIGSRQGYGLAAFGRFMAEDNMIGLSIWHELGLRHDLSCDVAENAIGRMTFMDYIRRRIRWIRVRKKMTMAATLLEPFTESVLLGVLTAISVRYLVRVPIWLFLLAHFSYWMAVDLTIYTALARRPLSRSEQWPLFYAWAVRELCALPVWFVAVTGSTVVWRGTKYDIIANGEA